MQPANRGRSDPISIRPPIAPHLQGSAVLKMLQEDDEYNHVGSAPVNFGSWPPPGAGQSEKPLGFFNKVSRGPGGRPVEWPPRSELSQSQEHLDQVPKKQKFTKSGSEPAPPPVPPRPANYPQAKMDQVQVQQQHQQQQMVMQQQQQQQQRQQVSSSVQMKTVKQVQEHQSYEQHFSGGSQGTTVRYQLPPQQQQQTFQYQTSQQTLSSSGQQVPQGMEHQIPVQMHPAAPSQHQGPRHGVPTPFANANRMAPSQPPNQNVFQNKFSNQNVAPPQQYANQNAAPSQQFTNQNAPPPQEFVNQNVPPQQFANQNVAPTQQFANQAPPPQQFTNQNAAPSQQFVNQNVTPPQQNFQAARDPAPSQSHESSPNLTTTYPSGFKLKEAAPLQSGPAKVVTSQPAFKITQPIRKSGDAKWPPKGSAEPTQEEVREFIKPKKGNRNYEEFFAQNALPHNYAGYRPPPGTQHRGVNEEEEGVSNM